MDTKHPDEGTLHAYVEGQLPAAEHSRVDEHVAGCAECATLVAEARGLIAAASGIIGALDDVPANVIPRRRVRRLPPWIAAAAVVVLAAGLSTVAVRSRVDSGPDVLATASDVMMEARQQDDLQQRTSAVRDTVSREQGVVGEPASRPPASVAGKSERRASRATVATEPQNVRGEMSERRERALAFTRADGLQAAAPAAPAAAPAVSASGEISSDLEEATITGRVISERGQPLASANVFINELNLSVATDASGAYSLTIPSSRLGQVAAVRARAIGYAPQSQRIAMTAGTQTADFELRRELTQLSEVVVTGSTVADEARMSDRTIGDVRGATADSVSARNAETRALRHQVEAAAPMRTIRYEVAAGTIVELREFHALVRVPPAESGVNQYRWSDSAGTRQYILSGRLPVAELERLAGRLGELRVVR